MPELPDITAYLETLKECILNRTLQAVRIVSPFLLRTATPPITAASGKKALRLRRVGKRICIGLEDDLWLVLHLMIAGRLHWRPLAPSAARPKISPPRGLAAFDFHNGSLLWTEAGSQKRASLHVVLGEDGLGSLDPGGLEVLDATLDRFSATLCSANHTLKHALTDPRLFSGIGNAYSDEILWEAKLSPLALTQKLPASENRAPIQRRPHQPHPLDRSSPCRGSRQVPRKSHSLSRRYGCPRPLQTTLSPLRHQNPANPLRFERDQLLSHLPNRRQTPRRPRALPPSPRRLAALPRRTGAPYFQT